MGLSLEKKSELVRLTLEKRQIPANIMMQVKSCIDVSGSIQSYFNNGTIQELVDRLIAVAMRFDDNQSLESYAFSTSACQLSDIKPSHFGSYVDNVFLPEAGKKRVLWNGTKYSNALELIKNDLKPVDKKTSMFGGMFGKKPSTPETLMPTYLMFITDGETNGDERQTENLVKELLAHKVYIQMIGVGRADFSFIERLGDDYDHVGFVTFPNLTSMSDEQLYNELLTDELATWIKNNP